MTTSKVRERAKEIQRLCEVKRKAEPTYVIEVEEVFREVDETKRNNTKLFDRIIDLVLRLQDVQLAERWVCDGAVLQSRRDKTR